MNPEQKEALLTRILEHFETIAPVIVKESVQSLATDHPLIDLYDADYYLEKARGAFDDVDDSDLQSMISEYSEQIDDIFFKLYKTARKPKTSNI